MKTHLLKLGADTCTAQNRAERGFHAASTHRLSKGLRISAARVFPQRSDLKIAPRYAIARLSIVTALLLTVVALVTTTAIAQPEFSEPPAARDKRMEWFREARFGMFVHWGLYSGLAGTWDGKVVATRGGMEWIQNQVKADSATYAKAAIPLFKPKPDFAHEWARLAKAAGCRYLVFTTKHHDGFALHDSAVSEFDAGSVLHRDLVKEIVAACKAEGLRVGFYHSMIDWHHDQYEYAKSKQLPHPLKGKPYPNGARDQSKYQDYLAGEVRELVSNYGRVDLLWWDFSAQDFQGQEAWRAFDLMRMVREQQPKIVMNNRLFRSAEAGWTSMAMEGVSARLDNRYGDYVTPEQHIPPNGLPGVDWETCMTMNTTWGYSAHDPAWKTSRELIRNLVDIASKGGNYLLNIGPTGDGSVPVQSVDALKEIGAWLKVNSKAIYDTTASPFAKQLSWGRCTRKGDKLYLHIFDWPADGKLFLPLLNENVKAKLLATPRAKINMLNGPDGLVLQLPPEAPDKSASVLELRVRGELTLLEGAK